MADAVLPTGKLPPEMLASLLGYCQTDDPRVVVGAKVGVDAAVLNFGERLLVAKSDPITFASDRIGWYAVHVNANDVAAMGAEPRWMLVTVLLPQRAATYEMARAIMEQMAGACRDLGLALVGGHTEVTHGLDHPLVVGHMLGEVAADRLITAAGAQVGDALVLAGGIAIEGTALIAREFPERSLSLGVDADTLAVARNYLDDPGISVVRAACIATTAVPVHAMHDPTEGGLAMGVHELAWAAGVGLQVQSDAVPVLPECRRLCAAFGLDPFGLIASGALLLAVAQEDLSALARAYDDAGILWARIGTVHPREHGVRLLRDGAEEPLPRYDRDEITRLFG